MKHLDPIFKTLAPGTGDIPRTPGPREARRHRRTGLSALRPERRRPLREDGSQRHRVRRHGGIRRGPGRTCATPTLASRTTKIDAETTPLRDPEHYQYDLNLARHRGGVAARQRHRFVAARSHGAGAGQGSRACRNSPAVFPIPAKAAGRSKLRSTKAYRCRFSPPRFTSVSVPAARPTFQDKLLSAMRYQFGGHLEKSGAKQAA